MTKLNNMRVVRIPPFAAVSSGEKTFDELFSPGGFDEWCAANPRLFKDGLYEPNDFLWHTGDKATYGSGTNVWIKAAAEGVTPEDAAPYELTEFPGGIFLVATADESDTDDINATVDCMMRWIADSDVFDYGDFPESGMCNMPAPDSDIDRRMNISQQQIFLPLKFSA